MHACRFAIALVCTGSLAAATAPAPVANAKERSEAVKLHADARRSGDLWTCLQIEGWISGQRDWSGSRPAPAWGTSAIYGDTCLAFPTQVRHVLTRDGYLLVCAGRRLHRMAFDGRPLAPSTPLPVYPDQVDAAFDGTCTGVADMVGGHRDRRLLVATAKTPSGEAIIPQQTIGIPRYSEEENDFLTGSLAVADDGSAVLVASNHHPRPYPRCYLVVQGAETATLEDVQDPQAVGPKGAWHIARYHQRDARGLCLVVAGQKPMELRGWAPGPSRAVILAQKRLGLVQPDGQIQEWSPVGTALGNDPNVWTIGGWLVVASGQGAQRGELRDCFGNLIEANGPQPQTLGFYRWSDLARDPAAPPRDAAETGFIEARNHHCSLLMTEGRRVLRLDLSGERIQRLPLAELPDTVDGVWNSHHYQVAALPGGRRVVFDAEGRIRWDGSAMNVWIHSRTYGLIETAPKTYAAICLALDPAERKTLPFTQPEGTWSIHVDGHGRFIIGTNDDGWFHLGLDGALVKKYAYPAIGSREWPPQCFSEDNLAGGCYRRGGRLVAKATGIGEDAPDGVWAPHDALFSPRTRTLLVLDQGGWIAASSRKKGEYDLLGRCEDADRFGFQPKSLPGRPILANRQGKGIAMIDAGPKLVTEGSFDGQSVDSPDDPRWGINQNGPRYKIPPSGDILRWKEEKSGFAPHRLRGPDVDVMLLITPSLVIDIARPILAECSVKGNT